MKYDIAARVSFLLCTSQKFIVYRLYIIIGASVASPILVTSVDNFSVCMYVCMYVCNGTFVGLIAGFYTRGPYQFRVFLVYFAQLEA